MPIYNKLVRDLIPDIISNTGKKYHTRVLNESEFTTELRLKLKEELDEYLAANTDEDALDELADMLEVIHALASQHGASLEELDNIREVKVQKRGSFKEKIFLIEVADNEMT
ncbi:nucleoside triphosphate pyrophosphohydrolase [Chengkuizengella axinellae]|uniref:Nucleoside triphosphate pyrophosphohydrolase n=1 Tax=Chengkuizengella axinellae TaxID=3064388 RepID=A0ABT9J2Y7_9BACL|nr:nucleoside triphosphate pyrophosphohydrolase [Chengkuizengella sp. 2205SS18-9]MDP5275991.1 nucleoside triphosphate pyrophosphohydrolase [Chengkuizengella sp. 2205SS18-9]